MFLARSLAPRLGRRGRLFAAAAAAGGDGAVPIIDFGRFLNGGESEKAEVDEAPTAAAKTTIDAEEAPLKTSEEQAPEGKEAEAEKAATTTAKTTIDAGEAPPKSSEEQAPESKEAEAKKAESDKAEAEEASKAAAKTKIDAEEAKARRDEEYDQQMDSKRLA